MYHPVVFFHIMNRKEVITIEKTIQMNSVTQAMRARDLLKAKGIKAKVKRIPSDKGPCSYGIIISDNFEKALEILNKNKINYVGRAVGKGL